MKKRKLDFRVFYWSVYMYVFRCQWCNRNLQFVMLRLSHLCLLVNKMTHTFCILQTPCFRNESVYNRNIFFLITSIGLESVAPPMNV